MENPSHSAENRLSSEKEIETDHPILHSHPSSSLNVLNVLSAVIVCVSFFSFSLYVLNDQNALNASSTFCESLRENVLSDYLSLSLLFPFLLYHCRSAVQTEMP